MLLLRLPKENAFSKCKAVKQSSLGIVAVCKELEQAAAVLLDKKIACTA